MLIVSQSCSWCHEINVLNRDGCFILATYCKKCGHRADVSRAGCDCERCSTPSLYNHVVESLK